MSFRLAAICSCLLLPGVANATPPAPSAPGSAAASPDAAHHEIPDDPYVAVPAEDRVTSPARRIARGGALSVQVNVDENGQNIVGDAANEPSIAVDFNNSQRVSIGWRQFDTIASNFRQAGYGTTADGGTTWTTGILEAGLFRSDPILDSDTAGNFYYNSLSVPGGTFQCTVFRSSDGGANWDGGVFAFGGDKAWMTVDRGPSSGNGHVYSNWNQSISCCPGTSFTRSSDGGDNYDSPIATPSAPFWGTTAAAPSGNVYVAGNIGTGQLGIAKSTTLADAGQAPAFDSSTPIAFGGTLISRTGPNPGGLLGQVWVATAPSAALPEDEVYVLSSIDPPGADPLDVHFVRSTDGGQTWSAPVRVNDDVGNAWQWFGTMSVAPNGRIDVIWADSREDPGGFDSALYYSYSTNAGLTWAPNIALSPTFDPHLGWPQQEKLGDYYDMKSEDDVVHIAWAATFNGEQDVYYTRLGFSEPIFTDGFESGDTTAWPAP